MENTDIWTQLLVNHIIGTNLTPVAPGQSYVCKVAHLQVVVVVKAVWGIFNNTNTSLYLQVNTLLVIYKSCYYSIYYNWKFPDIIVG